MKRSILLTIAVAVTLAISAIPTYATVGTGDWNGIYMDTNSPDSIPVVIDEFNLLGGADIDWNQVVPLHILSEYDTFTEEGISEFENAIMSGSQIFDMLEDTSDFFVKTSANDTVILSLQEDGTFIPQVTMIGDNGNMFMLASNLQMQMSSFGLSVTPNADAKCVGIPGVGTAIVFADGENEVVSFTVSRFPELVTEHTLYTVEDIATIMVENKEIITGAAEVTEAISITLDKSTATISVGDTLALTATVLPNDATDKTVTWTSSAPGVATVNASGVVTGVNTGTATITATTVNGLTASCEVTVEASQGIPLPESVVIEIHGDYSGDTEWYGDTAGVLNYECQLTARVYPDGASQDVIWESDDPDIISVDDNGMISRLYWEMSTTIRARTVNGIEGTFKVFFKSPEEEAPR